MSGSAKKISLVIRTQISTENCRIRKTTLITILKNLFAVLAAAGAATAAAYYFFQSLASYSSPKLKWLKEIASDSEYAVTLQLAVPLFVGSLFLLVGAFVALWRSSTRSPVPERPAQTSGRMYSESKIEKLRWSSLTSLEQQELFDAHLQLAPIAQAPVEVLAPADIQLSLCTKEPIELRFISVFWILCPDMQKMDISFPLTAQSFHTLNVLREKTIDRIRRDSSYTIPRSARAELRDLYDYLSCRERAQGSPADLDAIVVAAARWSMPNRVSEASRLYRFSGAKIILTGGRPSYDDDRQAQIAEAEVMHFQLMRDGNAPRNEDVFLETRSRTSMEALINSRSMLARLAASKRKPLSIGLVSSTFHMRRFLIQAKHHYYCYPQLVSGIVPFVVPGAVDAREFFNDESPLSGRAQVVLQTFLSEYLKLICGRGVGEF